MSDWVREGPRPHLTVSVMPRLPLESAGSFTGGGHKIVWHTAEGTSLIGTYNAVKLKRAAPHFILDPFTGKVVQCVSLDEGARALEHDLGTPETNRANAIQVELVAFSDLTLAIKAGHREMWVGNWKDKQYDHIASLAIIIERHFEVPRHVRNFTKPVKFTGPEFVKFAGHCGHVHVPGNIHWDPSTFFRGRKVINYMNRLDP